MPTVYKFSVLLDIFTCHGKTSRSQRVEANSKCETVVQIRKTVHYSTLLYSSETFFVFPKLYM